MDGFVGLVREPAFLVVVCVLLVFMSVVGLFALGSARRAREALWGSAEGQRQARSQIEGVLASLREGVVVTSSSGEVILISDSAVAILGIPNGDVIGRPLSRLPIRAIDATMHPVNLQEAFSARYGTAGVPKVVGVPGRRGAEDVRWIQVRTSEIEGAHPGGPINVSTIQDASGTRDGAAAESRTDALYRRAVENAPVGIALMDLEWRVMEANRTFAAIFGTTVAAMRGTPFASITHRDDLGKEKAQAQELYEGTITRFSLEQRFVKVDGSTVWGVMDVGLVRHAGGAPDHFVVHLRETNEERIRKEHLEHRAERDPLTQLANRTRFFEMVRKALEEPDVIGHVAIVVVDLDGFKGLNDRFGHAMGDNALRHVATGLRQVVGTRGVPARLGGDEFAIVVTDPEAAKAAFDIATGVHEWMRRPLEVRRHRIALHASVGVAVASDDTLSNGEMSLVDAADAAMYRAKAEGKSRTEIYTPAMRARASTQGALASDLKRAVENGDLVLHYQPILELSDRTVVGHEALVRWQHPTRGLLLPGSFLPLLSDKALSVQLGGMLVDQAAAFLASNRDSPTWVSLNVSADQLGDSEFADRVLTSLARHHLAHQRIVVELTEASLVAPNTRIRHELTELRNAGVPILLDDFGTGVSPLSYLRDLPVSGVKLDMSFTSGIPEDPAGARVSRALGALARELGLATIAEGIETEAQAEFLLGCGWRYGQGWLFGVAQPAIATRNANQKVSESYIDPTPADTEVDAADIVPS